MARNGAGKSGTDKSGTGKMVRKGDLPTKPCAQCGRPFVWRKKWERVWDEVRYCSDRCRGEAKKG